MNYFALDVSALVKRKWYHIITRCCPRIHCSPAPGMMRPRSDRAAMGE